MDKLFLFLKYRISMVYLLLFLCAFLPLRYKKLKSLCIVSITFFLMAALDYISFFVDDSEATVFLINIFEIITVQTTAMVLSAYRSFKTLFISISSSVYVLTGNVFGIIAFYSTSNNIMNLLAQIIVHSATLVFLVWRIRNYLIAPANEKEEVWAKLCIIPALFYAVIYSLIVWPRSIYNTPENIPALVLVLVLMYVSYVLVFELFEKWKKESRLTMDMEYLKNYGERLLYETERIQRNEAETRFIRHDLKHYMLMINAYLDEGDTASVRRLVAQFEGRLDEITPTVYCANPAINGILASCAHRAAEHSVEFQAEIDMPSSLAINIFEFVAVLSNLLENAVWAAGNAEIEQKRVEIKLKKIKEQIILEIRNSFAGSPEISEKTGLPMTQKGKGHGYGLRSVLAFVERNGAVFDYTIENQQFCVRLLVVDKNSGEQAEDL